MRKSPLRQAIRSGLFLLEEQMSISTDTIKKIKYPPELIPDSFFGNLPAGAEFGNPMISLLNFQPFIVELTKIQTLQNANATLRLRYDNTSKEVNTGGLLPGFIGAWRLPAIQQLFMNFFGIAPVVAHSSFYSVWGYPPTIAHKIFWGIPLTEAEKAIDKQLNISENVQKGMLPLPISSIIERQYEVLGEETHTQNPNIVTAGVNYLLENLIPRSSNEFLVLTRIAAAPGTTAQNIIFTADRDNDSGIIQMPTFPLSLTLGGEARCFIPAIQKLHLYTSATVAPGITFFRYTLQRIRLSNILKLRFGLITQDQLASIIGTQKAADLAMRVQAGLY
jgi:hypothetical protein